MIPCHFSELELQVIEAYGSLLILDDEIKRKFQFISISTSSLDNEEINLLHKELARKEERYLSLSASLPKSSELFVGNPIH